MCIYLAQLGPVHNAMDHFRNPFETASCEAASATRRPSEGSVWSKHHQVCLLHTERSEPRHVTLVLRQVQGWVQIFKP